jgi:hypothetical protein
MMHLGIDIFKRSFRNTLIPYEMDVFRYLQNSFLKADKIKEVDFHLDVIDISYFTARTLCSYHLTQRELYFDIIASLLSHLNFIDATKTNLLLIESRYKRLRDFSKSSRVGEMAQGINSYFVSKRLNFPYIIDFDLAKEKTQATLNIQTNGKSPDFVVLDLTMTEIGLFESKGNMNGNITYDLIGAMNQINDVISPCFDYKIPVSTRFQDNNDYTQRRLRKVRKSSVNYASIKKDCTAPKETELLRKLHYASWFYLVGDFTRVESILNDGVVLPIQDENDPIYVLDIETDKNNPIYWVEQPIQVSLFSKEYGTALSLFITSRFFRRCQFKIGIYKKVIESLIKTQDTNTIFQLPDGEINYLRKYPDGTLLYLRTNK